MAPITLMAISATVPTKLEMINSAVCLAQQEARGGLQGPGSCSDDPRVQATSAAIIAGLYMRAEFECSELMS